MRSTTRVRAIAKRCAAALAGAGLGASLAAQPPATTAPAEPAGADAAPTLEPPVAVAALVRAEVGRPPDDLIYVRLNDGSGTVLDRLRRDPTRTRATRLEVNLFELIGRSRDRPARPGELFLAPIHTGTGAVRSALLVEASTGYVAYFPQLGKGGTLGAIRTTLGRTFAAIAADDGAFALMMRRGRNGRTVEAVLYHGPSGRAMGLLAVDEHPLEPRTRTLAGMPRLGGAVAGITVDGDDQRSRGYLLIDQTNGAVRYVRLADDGAVLGVDARTGSLLTVFPATPAQAAEPRFLPVPVTDGDGEVRDLLIVDAGSGQLAWLTDPAGRRGTSTLRRLRLDIARLLSARGPPAVRSLAAVPRRVGEGATLGAWLIDGRSRRVLAIDDLLSADGLRVAPVTANR